MANQAAPTRWQSFKRSMSLSWVTVLIAFVAILFSCIYYIASSKGYFDTKVPELTSTSIEPVVLQKCDEEYFTELSDRLIKQFHDELADVHQKVEKEMADVHQKVEKEMAELADVHQKAEKELADVYQKVEKEMAENRKLYSEENMRRIFDEEFVQRNKVKELGVDYASTFLGCKIYSHSPTHSHGRDAYKVLNVVPLFKYDREPDIVLNRLSEKPPVGLCWAFKGAQGYLTLQLPDPVKVNEIVYNHVSKNLEPASLSKTAPRSIEIWGGTDPDDLTKFGETEFTRENATVSIVLEKPTVAKYIKFAVKGNYGGDYTCLYRVHVHGTLDNSI